MGKLHSLRKAIEKDPEKWIHTPLFSHPRPKAADFKRGQWVARTAGWYYGHSYVAFVRHCLKELGYLGEEPKKIRTGGRQRRCGTCGRLYVPQVKRRGASKR